MTRTRSPWVLMALDLLVAWALSGCSGDSEVVFDFEARLLNASAGHVALDLYVDEPGAGRRLLLPAVEYQTVSDFASVRAGSYEVLLRRPGSASTLFSVRDYEPVRNRRVTYIAYGDATQLGLMRTDERSDPSPDPGRALLRVFNASGLAAADIHLSERDGTLTDQAPLVVDLPPGTHTVFHEVASGDYRLRVTSGGNAGDLRLDIPSLALESGEILSLVLADAPGGVLLDGVLLPRDREPGLIPNTRSRIRAAHGLSIGVALAVRVGGVSLLSSATQGVISDYALVEAGTTAVELSVDGHSVPLPEASLAAGRDYTLLAWNDAEQVRVTLLEDDNHRPAGTGFAKLRLLNGISGASGPINLLADYYPIAGGVPLGDTSGYREVQSGTDIRLDVVSAATAGLLWSRDENILLQGRVYTLLMTGRDGETISGTLRRDR